LIPWFSYWPVPPLLVARRGEQQRRDVERVGYPPSDNDSWRTSHHFRHSLLSDRCHIRPSSTAGHAWAKNKDRRLQLRRRTLNRLPSARADLNDSKIRVTLECRSWVTSGHWRVNPSGYALSDAPLWLAIAMMRFTGKRASWGLTVSLLKDDGGRVVGVSSIARDVTHHKRCCQPAIPPRTGVIVGMASIVGARSHGLPFILLSAGTRSGA
jgi:hypothetical protein